MPRLRPTPRNRLSARDTRENPRYALPAMYTFIRLRAVGQERYRWSGHIYDISAGGLRFEVDAPIAEATAVELCATLPGRRLFTLRAVGRIVRRHDEPTEPGPVRLALAFDRMAAGHRRRLDDYLAGVTRRAA